MIIKAPVLVDKYKIGQAPMLHSLATTPVLAVAVLMREFGGVM